MSVDSNPSWKREKYGPSVRAAMRGHMEEEIRELNLDVKPSSRSSVERLHAPVSADVLSIIHSIRIEVARTRQDLALVHAMEGQLVIQPDEIDAQLRSYEQKLAAAKGDTSQLNIHDYKFMDMGGHVSHTPIQRLENMVHHSQNGYVLIAKYMGEEGGIPVGYNYGFSSLPRDPTLPNLSPESIPKPENELFSEQADKIWCNWRTGVVRSFDDDLTQKFEEQGVRVLPHFYNKSAQRWGVANAFKRVIARAAQLLEKQLIIFNIGKLKRKGEIAVAMPNVASKGANQEIFAALEYTRTYSDEIRNAQQQVVAEVLWRIWGGTPETVQGLQDRPGSVLRGKGWELEHLNSAGAELHSEMVHKKSGGNGFVKN